FGFAEIATVSFINLLVVLRHYRGVEVPDTKEYSALLRWREAFTKDPLFTEVNVDPAILIPVYKKYAA
ncbi:hypothetical protein LPJ81_007197, partial [Coemansia sp. IMI 209127]